ncbi:MAG TPA: hypothetical protein DCE42_31285 [Myxococcales bacterium]|nr:hypothetical protein [Deltaproteobacteria bacterium]HAA59274.1 hypothetical protein [Myxococcales bacterium]
MMHTQLRRFTWTLCWLLGVLYLGCIEPEPPPAETTNELGPAGGVFRGEEVQAILSIPPGALTQGLRFEMLTPKTPEAPTGYTALSPVVQIEPVLTFPEGLPAKLTLPLDLTKLPDDRTIWDVVFFRRDGETWTRLANTVEESSSSTSAFISETGSFIACVGPKRRAESPPFEDLREYDEPARERVPDASTEPAPESTQEPVKEKPIESSREPASEPSKTEPSPESSPEGKGSENVPDASAEFGNEALPESSEPTKDD